jgi:plastocyanin
MKRLTIVFGLVALAAVLAACSGASAAPATATPAPAASGAPSGDGVSIVAKDLKFAQTQVSVKAGAAFSIDFDNRDGAPHNIAISDASGSTVFQGDIVSATKVTYSVPALAAGTYTFTCQVHPDMKGTITAQ